MTIQNFTHLLMLSAILSSVSVFAEEASTTEKAKEVEKAIAVPVENAIVAPVSQDEVREELEAARRKLIEMKAPRDLHMAAVGELTKQMEARRQAILQENEVAAQLNADIVELDKTLQEKALELQAIFGADESLIALQVKAEEARANFDKNQFKLREEIAKQHRERRLAMETAKQNEALAKATEAEATQPDEGAKEKAAQ